MPQERSNVVIVGGGVAGLHALKSLASKLDLLKYNLILITARPYFTHLAGTIRAIVTAEGSLADRIRIPYDELENANSNAYRIVIGKVASLELEPEDEPKEVRGRGRGGSVVLEGSGERISYSVLVLATGRRLSGPLEFPDTFEESDQWVAGWRDKIEKAHHVVLVGGGAAGTGEYYRNIFWPKFT